jgi:myo-inositol-1(or 4)-monophosphatase
MRESAISIGYIENGQPISGVIYDPYKEELYEVEKGLGAHRNGQPISVSDQSSLEGASIATSNSYDDKAMARNLERHLALYNQTQIMPWTSCPGSGVLIMAWVACGRIDAYHHNGLKPWDNAVAFLLVREAGGDVQTLSGEQAGFTSQTTLMGNKEIVKIIRDVFSNVSPDLLR